MRKPERLRERWEYQQKLKSLFCTGFGQVALLCDRAFELDFLHARSQKIKIAHLEEFPHVFTNNNRARKCQIMTSEVAETLVKHNFAYVVHAGFESRVEELGSDWEGQDCDLRGSGGQDYTLRIGLACNPKSEDRS